MDKLNGKVALITGGSSGIGRATAILFAEEGAKVVVTADQNVNGGEETVKIIKVAGGEAIFVIADVSKATDVQRMVRTTEDTYGRLDILFNNAGIWEQRTLLADLSEEDWDRTIDVNLKGVFLGMKYAIPEMLKRGGGVIVNTASENSFAADLTIADYCASKGGVLMLTKAAALEYARQNIRVNCVCPGGTVTLMVERAAEKAGQPLESYIAQWVQNVPLGRWAQPEEIAKAVLFLASDDSSYITGTSLLIDGGSLAK